MSTSEYGQYSVFSSWLSILTCFVSLNIYRGVYTEGLVKFSDIRHKYAAAFQGLLFTLCLIWLGIYLVFYQPIDQALEITFFQGVFMVSIIWTDGVYQLWAQQQRVEYQYKSLVIVTLIHAVSAPLIEILLITISSDKVTARIFGLAFTSLICFGWMCFQQIYAGKTFFSRKIWKHAIWLSVPLIPHYLSQMILNSSDRIMIQKMVGSSEAGIYSLAYSVSLIMTVFNISLLSTIEPWIYQKIKSKEIEKLSKAAYPSFILIASVNLLLIAFAPEIIKIFVPAEYYEAIWVIPPVAISVYFKFMYSFYALFEFYYEKTNYITIATLTGAIINTITNAIFIKIFGYMAAGYTTLACYIIYTVMHYHFMKIICKKNMDGAEPYNLKIIAAVSLGFMALGFLLMAFYNYPVIRYIFISFMILMIILKRKELKNIFLKFLNMRQEGRKNADSI